VKSFATLVQLRWLVMMILPVSSPPLASPSSSSWPVRSTPEPSALSSAVLLLSTASSLWASQLPCVMHAHAFVRVPSIYEWWTPSYRLHAGDHNQGYRVISPTSPWHRWRARWVNRQCRVHPHRELAPRGSRIPPQIHHRQRHHCLQHQHSRLHCTHHVDASILHLRLWLFLHSGI